MSFPNIRPNDYYGGENLRSPIPMNVLLFARNRRADLNTQFVFCHSRYNLIISLEGESGLIVDDSHLVLPKGCAIVTHPWQIFRFLFDADSALEWVFFGFDLDDQDAELPRSEVRVIDNLIHYLAGTAVDRLQDRGSGPWLVSTLLLILEELKSMPAHTGTDAFAFDSHIPLILRIQGYIRNHARRPLNLRWIAREFNMSESRIRQLYREVTGVSLGSFIRDSRMNEAARLLTETGDPISAISDICSFSSVQVFSRAFRNRFGMSPRTYRRPLIGRVVSSR